MPHTLDPTVLSLKVKLEKGFFEIWITKKKKKTKTEESFKKSAAQIGSSQIRVEPCGRSH